jgi:hypothetical protein
MSVSPIVDYLDISTTDLGENINDNVEISNDGGYSTIALSLTIPTGATVEFQGSFDGTNFTAITFRSVSTNEYVQNSTTSGIFLGSIIGTKLFRVITTSGGSAPGSISARLNKNVAILEGIEHGDPNSSTNSLETNRAKLMVADDLVKSFTWSDFGTSTQRVATMILDSSSLGITATGTFNYTLVSGAYRLDNITWVVT